MLDVVKSSELVSSSLEGLSSPLEAINSKDNPSSEEIKAKLICLGCEEIQIRSVIEGVATDFKKQHLLLINMLFEKITHSDNPNTIDEEVLKWLPTLADSNRLNLFLFSVTRGNEGNVKKIYKRFQNDPLIFHKDEGGRSALHLAAINGHSGLVKFLLDTNLGGLEDKDNDGLIPLHWAILNGQHDVVRILLEKGCLPSFPLIRKDGAIMSPLVMAIESGKPEILELLLKNDPHHTLFLDCPVHGIGNVLHLAIHSNRSSMLRHILRERHADTQSLLNQQDKIGRTPLQLAAFLGDLLAIRLLHEQNVDINRGEGCKGGTALHYAAEGEQEEAITLLVFLGANSMPLDVDHRTPATLLADKQTPKAKRCCNLLNRLARMARKDITQPPDYSSRPPQNLVFQGGGPKGVAYIGAIEEMEKCGVLTELKRLGGTSAGAITAALLAVGYSGKDLEKHLTYDFTKFLDYGDDLKKGLFTGLKAQSFTQAIQTLWNEYWGGWQTLLNPLQRAEKVQEKLMSLTGFCKGESFREWVEGLISNATGVSHCTFRELDELIKKNPEKYKELHIFATQVGKEQKITRFSAEDPRWGDLIISDALRASMSIPGVFDPHTLHFKDISGKRHIRSDHGQFVDGGLVRNFPLDAFDEKKYQESPHEWGEKTNRRTLGVRLNSNVSPVDPALDVNSPISLAKSLIAIYLDAQDMLLREKAHVQDRIISIPIKDVGMVDFDINEEKKTEMKDSGKTAISSFFADSEKKK